MRTQGFALFPTAIGTCAVAWGEGAITAMNLPDAKEDALRQRMQRRHPDAPQSDPPEWVQAVIGRVRSLLEGGTDDLLDVPLDMDGIASFHRRVYELSRRIPPGRTRTYGEIARELGEPGSARAVGQALGANPFAPIVPCHRVLAAGTGLGGFSARGGLDTKLRMLGIEGARITEAHERDLF